MAEKADTGNRREGLSEAKRRLLEKRLRGRAAEAPGIARRPEGAAVPATPYQAAIWFLNRLVGDTAAYNLHAALEIRGCLDLEDLAAAWATVVGRHESLRLLIHARQDGLYLDFDAVTGIALEHFSVPGDGRESAFVAAAGFAGRPFDMQSGPLCRAGVFTMRPDAHLFVLAVHHSVCDEHSVEILLRDLLEDFGGRRREEKSASRSDFGDYAHALPRRLAATRDGDLDYWRATLEGLPERLDLPADHPREKRASYRGALYVRECPGLLSARRSDVAGTAREDLYANGLAACLLTLSRYCGADDLAVGSPVSLRDSTPVANMVGMFVNPVVVRTPSAERGSVADYVSAVRHRVNEALEHRNLPFETLVSELAPHRDATHNPFFQVMFVLETRPAIPEVPGLDIEFRRLDTGTSKLDLTVFLRRAGDGAEITVEYNSGLFDAPTIAAMTDAYARVLREMLADPGRRLDELSLAGESSGDRPAAATMHGPRIDVSGEPLLPEAIARAAACAPEAAAVTGAGKTLSYAELERMADQLAGGLAPLGAGPDVPVALLMDPGPDMVAAMTGVHRAGAAYVPLDPDWPRERLEDALAQLAAANGQDRALVVADTRRIEMAEAMGHRVTGLSAPPPSACARPPRAREVAPEGLAYVIFTSGSSGRPKGVAVEHGNLRHSNLARRAYYPDAPETFLLLSPLHFDSSVAGLFWTLAAGGTLVMPEPEERGDPRHLAGLIESRRVTHTLLLPSLYRLLLQAAQRRQLATLRTVIVAGEPCPQSLVDLHRACLPDVELVNEYGPTEATVWASAWRAGADADPVSLGGPVANTTLAVRDPMEQPLPQGAAGELWIGGGGVARGYLGDQGLTAQQFRTWSGPEAERLYRTGDRVRQRPDGTLEYLGRLDDQLKIRGHRVGPEAIEDRLRALPGISDAAVTAGAGGQRLLAWCVKADAEPPDSRALRRALGEHLPAYAIPDRFEFIAALPRTGTGKVDRRALAVREPAAAGRAGDRRPDASRDDGVNEGLREIWRRLLQTDRIAADDDFFDAGGHSLLGVQLLLEIEARFGRSLPLAALFESPTLGALSARVEAPVEARPTAVSPVRAEGSLTPLFCVHGAIRRVAPHLHPDRPVFLVYKDLGTEAFQDLTVGELAADYLRELKAVQAEGPYHLCGFSFGGQIAYEMARQLLAAGDSVGLLGLLDPPPVTDDGYLGTLLRRKQAQLREVPGLAGKARFVLSELSGGAARALERQRRYLAARRRERRGDAMATGEIQERDRRNYIRASRAYGYPAYAGGAVLVLPDRIESVRAAAAAGFADRVEGPLTVRVARGAPLHEDMMKEPHCRWLGAVLEEAMGDGTAPDSSPWSKG